MCAQFLCFLILIHDHDQISLGLLKILFSNALIYSLEYIVWHLCFKVIIERLKLILLAFDPEFVNFKMKMGLLAFPWKAWTLFIIHQLLFFSNWQCAIDYYVVDLQEDDLNYLFLFILVQYLFLIPKMAVCMLLAVLMMDSR